MEKYLNYVHDELSKIRIQGQALIWFLSFKLSQFLIPSYGIGFPFFDFILQFMLSLIIVVIGILVISFIISSRYDNNV